MISSMMFGATGVSADGLDKSNMPRSICGWPSLHTTGRFPPWSTRMAQRLLAFALNDSEYVVDGVFTDQTTADIKEFETKVGLEPDGYLNIDSWPSLMAMVTPLSAETPYSELPVAAVQDALGVSGFHVDITGVFDAATTDALSKFQVSRQVSSTSGTVVDEQTWHLLATQCNATLPGYYWFDVGWPQGNISVSTYKCLKDAGFQYAVIEAWRESGDNGTFWGAAVDNIKNAWEAGYDRADAYMYPQRYSDPKIQAEQLIGNLSIYNVKYGAVMLDIEGSKWDSYTIEENQEFILELRSVFDKAHIPIVIYCGPAWATYFGSNFTAFSDVPLVYAHYDNIPSYYDWDYAPVGGWTHANGKQFWDAVDEVVCNLGLDWDWSAEPFWM